jgi:hypothetical protein
MGMAMAQEKINNVNCNWCEDVEKNVKKMVHGGRRGEREKIISLL